MCLVLAYGCVAYSILAELHRYFANPTWSQWNTRVSVSAFVTSRIPTVATPLPYTCLVDSEPLWAERRRKVQRDLNAYCPLTSPPRPLPPVPVVMVVQATTTNKPTPLGETVFLTAYTANHAAKFNDHVYVIVIGAELAKFSTIRFASNVHLTLVSNRSDPLYIAHTSFDKHYKHRSVNRRGYEQACFRRWFVLNKFVQMNKMQSVFAIDYDLLLFTNVTQEVAQCYGGCRAAGSETNGTFSSYWQAAELQALTQSMIHFYRSGGEYLNQTHNSDMTVMRSHLLRSMPSSSERALCFDEVRGREGYSLAFPPQRVFSNIELRANDSRVYQDAIGMPFFRNLYRADDYVVAKSLHFQFIGKRMLMNCSTYI